MRHISLTNGLAAVQSAFDKVFHVTKVHHGNVEHIKTNERFIFRIKYVLLVDITCH